MASKGVPKGESGLQAVVICDIFSVSALPLETSWALLPLAGGRIIDFTVEFLLKTPVDEVIIFSVFYSDQVEQYIRKRWLSSGLTSFRMTFLSSKSCRSVGDVLRDLDARAIIKSDFLLTQAGFVTNDDLSAALSVHKSKRVKDKNAVLTLVYSECGLDHPARSLDTDVFLVLDTITNQLLHYQNVTNSPSDFEYPIEVLKIADEVTTRFDLLDCNIAICSPQIPPLFSDNFDFQTRRHLIREILTNEEILGYRMYVYVLNETYAAFIGDLNTYCAVNQHILDRWCFPILPHTLNGSDQEVRRYSCRWPNMYVAEGLGRIAKNARIEGSVLIGPKCEISSNTHLINVMMGENCIIGSNTVLKNCILWDNVVVEEDCVAEGCILCDGSKLGSRSRLHERCILGRNVSVQSGVEVPSGTILSKAPSSADSDIKSSTAGFAPNAFLWRLANTTSGDVPTEIWPSYINLKSMSLKEVAAGKSSDESSSEIEDTVPPPAEETVVDEGSSGEDEYEIFYQEVLESLQRGFAKQIDCDNLIMEINSSKHAYNVPVVELQRRVMAAILETAFDQNRIKTDTATDLVKAYKAVLAQFLPLIDNYFKQKNHSSSAISAKQSTCLDAIKDFAMENNRFTPAFTQVLFFLYDKDIIEEEVLRPWCTQLDEPLKSQVQPLIRWLDEAEEESSDSE